MSTVVNTIRNTIKNWGWFLIMGLMSLAAGIAILAKPAKGDRSLTFSLALLWQVQVSAKLVLLFPKDTP